RHRGGDRTYESRGPSRPLLSQRSRRRCRQRHPQRRRLQPSPRSRLAEDHFARHPTRALLQTFTIRPSPQTGFLTGDNLLSELVKGVSTEVVTRLTIALAVPILSAIDFEQQPAILAKVQGPLSVTGPKSAVAAKTAQLRIMTSPFVSASIKGL